ncbi:hypothetical protein CDAR_256791 [Caerostris darwini]|uniref:Uncharacterized protein n=1 Tax=Caerostris darwini TaxID=1538125 RepID=A0AAV4PZN0_9ARAC|nr:hypothetical protein CDAR_256791 [Caerostris darwini]
MAGHGIKQFYFVTLIIGLPNTAFKFRIQVRMMPVPFAKSRVPPTNSSEHFSTSRPLCPVFQKNSNHRLQNNRPLPIALGQLIPSIYYLFSNFACWALG